LVEEAIYTGSSVRIDRDMATITDAFDRSCGDDMDAFVDKYSCTDGTGNRRGGSHI
jgi:hypothetical protein